MLAAPDFSGLSCRGTIRVRTVSGQILTGLVRALSDRFMVIICNGDRLNLSYSAIETWEVIDFER